MNRASGIVSRDRTAGSLSRRHFLVRGGCALAAACTSSLGACASIPVQEIVPHNGRLELPLSAHPELRRKNGALRVRVPGASSPLDVLVTGEREYSVVSPVCTHLGCTVDVQGAYLVCPCHGSTYERSGRVVRGPAVRALQRFHAQLSPDDVLTIELDREAPHAS
jgi:cytochrome b6-f complex iron-sulfur subunit